MPTRNPRIHKMLRRCAGAFLTACFLAATSAHAGLLINQRSNGLPGAAADEVAPQRLFIGAGAMRLDDLRPGGRSVIVRLDREVLWEIDPRLRMYVEQPFAALRRRRLKAEREREEKRLQALERLEGAELEAWLERKGLRRDGKRIVRTEHLGPETIGHWHTEHVRIVLNDKPVIELWTTDDIAQYAPPPELFEFYDKVGLFPDDVVAALREVRGFPVRMHAEIDLDTLGAEIETQVASVHDWPEDPSRFELPQGYRRVDRFPARPRGEAAVAAPRCAQCGKRIEEAGERVPGSDAYVCSRRCLLEYIKGLRRKRAKA